VIFLARGARSTFSAPGLHWKIFISSSWCLRSPLFAFLSALRNSTSRGKECARMIKRLLFSRATAAKKRGWEVRGQKNAARRLGYSLVWPQWPSHKHPVTLCLKNCPQSRFDAKMSNDKEIRAFLFLFRLRRVIWDFCLRFYDSQ